MKAATTTIRSAGRALQVLRFLAKQPKAEASLSAIAAELAVGPSTAHHLVATLHGEGFLSQNPDNRWYRFGAEALWLATAILAQTDLLQEARSVMAEFATATDETITLAVADDDRIFSLHRVEPGIGMSATSGGARHAPSYCTAAGKVLASELPESQVIALLRQGGMAPRTPRTLTTPEAFLADLTWVRQHGLAVDNEEWTPGIRCVAVPVRNYAGAIVGALSTGGPVKRLDGEHLNRVIALLKQAGETVSRQLGFAKEGSKQKWEGKRA